MIYLSFDVEQKHFPYRLSEMNRWDAMSKKYQVPIIPVTPWKLYFDKELPIGVFNMIGPVNTSHYRFLKTLENEGVRYINDIDSARTADDKFLCNLKCKNHNIPTPKVIDLNTMSGHIHNFNGWMGQIIGDIIKYPCVIKYPNGGMGIGHYLIKNQNQFNELYNLLAITNCRIGNHYSGNDFFVEEFIKPPQGLTSQTLRIYLWKNKIVGAFYRKSKSNWISNIEDGSDPSSTWGEAFSDIGRHIEKELLNLCQKIVKVFNLKFAGLDFFETDNGYVLGEINSAPAHVAEKLDLFRGYEFDPIEEIVKELLIKE